MSTKTLLIILVLIAIVVAVAIGRGQRKHEDKDSVNPDSAPGTDFFSGFGGGGGGDTLVMTRVMGCGRSGRTLTFAGTCDAHILPAKERMSRFVLKAFSNTVRACYGFSMEDVLKCQKRSEDKDQWGWVKPKGESRFVVAKDGGFLRLYCTPLAGGSNCTVTVE